MEAMKDMKSRLQRQDGAIAKQDATISKQGVTIAKQGATIAEQGATIAEHVATIAKQGTTIEHLQVQSEAQDGIIANLQTDLREEKAARKEDIDSLIQVLHFIVLP